MAKYVPLVKTTTNNVITWYRHDFENHEYNEYSSSDLAYEAVKNDFAIDDILIVQLYEPSGITSWVAKS